MNKAKYLFITVILAATPGMTLDNSFDYKYNNAQNNTIMASKHSRQNIFTVDIPKVTQKAISKSKQVEYSKVSLFGGKQNTNNKPQNLSYNPTKTNQSKTYNLHDLAKHQNKLQYIKHVSYNKGADDEGVIDYLTSLYNQYAGNSEPSEEELMLQKKQIKKMVNRNKKSNYSKNTKSKNTYKSKRDINDVFHDKPANNNSVNKNKNQLPAKYKNNSGFSVSVHGVIDTHFHSAQNDDSFRIGRGRNQVAIRYTGDLPDILPTGLAILNNNVIFTNAQFNTTNKNNLVVLDGSPESISAAIALPSFNPQRFYAHDAGVLGDYSEKVDNKMQYNGFINVDVKQCIDNNCYGAIFEINSNLNRNIVTNEMKKIRAKGFSAYFSSHQLGSVYAGTHNDAASTMRLDASSISTADGGIDGDFFHYINTEGSYIAPTTIIDYGIDVQHPFHILPKLYSEYRHVPNAPYRLQGQLVSDEESPKISFFSPKDSPLKLGVSFTQKMNNTLFARDNNFNEADDYTNIITGGISYEYKDPKLRVKISVIGEHGEHENTDQYHNIDSYSIGGLFGVNFSKSSIVQIAGSYASLNQSGLPKQQLFSTSPVPLGPRMRSSRPIASPLTAIDVTPGATEYYTVGASYQLGSLKASATYFESKRLPYNTTEVNEFKNLVIGVHYDFDFGKNSKSRFTPYISYSMIETKEVAIGTNDNQNNSGNVFLVGAKLAF